MYCGTVVLCRLEETLKQILESFKIITPRSKADFCLHWSQVFGGPYLCRRLVMIGDNDEI